MILFLVSIRAEIKQRLDLYTMFSEKEEQHDEKLLNLKKRKLAQSSSTEKKHKSSPFK